MANVYEHFEKLEREAGTEPLELGPAAMHGVEAALQLAALLQQTDADLRPRIRTALQFLGVSLIRTLHCHGVERSFVLEWAVGGADMGLRTGRTERGWEIGDPGSALEALLMGVPSWIYLSFRVAVGMDVAPEEVEERNITICETLCFTLIVLASLD